MKQYQLTENVLILSVKRPPLFARGAMFFFAFLLFFMPLLGMVLYMASGNGFHIGFFFGVSFFSVLGFYLLRIALWNTYGNEVITITKNQVEYVADYGWFKDGRKQKEMAGPIQYSVSQIGYEDDNTGVLVIGEEGAQIVCATKMPVEEIQALISELK